MPRFLYHLVRTIFIFGWLSITVATLARAEEPKILVLGDSISAAYGMSLEQGWVAQLAERLAERQPRYTVVNASISGETTAGGLRRLPALLEEHAPAVVVVELGANDGLRGYPLLNLRSNLNKIATLSQQAGAEVILLPMEIPPNYGSRYTAGFRDSFELVADDTDSTLAPFVLDGVATNPSLMQADGLHPTIEAQPMLLQNIFPTLEQVLDAR